MIAKLIKDLRIGDKIYEVIKEEIIEDTVNSIILNSEGIITINNNYKGDSNGTLLIGRYENERFSDIKQAKIKQTELRKKHFQILLDTVEKANKTLADFVEKYSIIK